MKYDLEILVNERKIDNTIILVFADNNFKSVLLNWIIGLNKLNIENYLVISLDETLHDFLTQRGFPSYLSKLNNTGDVWKGKGLWFRRIDTIRKINNFGCDVILSDADAFWLQNPIPKYFCNPDADFVFSQGTIFPKDIVVKQKFVVCTGLFYSKANSKTQQILKEVLNSIQTTGDCQISFNQVLYGLGVGWENTQSAYTLEVKNQIFDCYTEIHKGTITDSGTKISVLPHHLFQRMHMPETNGVYIKHLLFRPSKDRRENVFAAFKEAGADFLIDDWENISFTKDSIQKIINTK